MTAQPLPVEDAPSLIVETVLPHVVSVTFNRPHKHNAFDEAQWHAVRETFEQLTADDTVRCILLRGAGGRAFSTGADISEFGEKRSTRAQAERYGSVVKGTWDAIIACPHPIVAAIDGLCVGGGLEIACLADIRVATVNSRFGMPLKNLGLVLAYPELEPVFRVAGCANTMEMLLEGAIFGPRDAVRLGLVSRIFPESEFNAAVLRISESIAAGAPLSARWHKKFVRRMLDPAPLAEEERAECFDCFDTQDFHIGRRAFAQKTAPEFVGR